MDINGNQRRMSIKYEAANRKEGLTLGELRNIVQEAMRADLGDGARVWVTVGWSRQIQRIEVEGS